MEDIDRSSADVVLVISDLSNKINFGNEMSLPFQVRKLGTDPI